MFIGQPMSGKTTTFNYITGRDETVSDGELDGTLHCSFGNFNDVELVDTPGTSDSKDQLSWWSEVSLNKQINLIIFQINGSSFRRSNNSLLYSIINHCKVMEYAYCIVWTHKRMKLEGNRPEIFLVNNDDPWEGNLPGNPNGDLKILGRSELIDYFKTVDGDSFQFLSPTVIMQKFQTYRDTANSLSPEITKTNDLILGNLLTLENQLNSSKEMIGLIGNIKNEIQEERTRVTEDKKMIKNKITETEEKIRNIEKAIEGLKSIFVDKKGDETKIRQDSSLQHVFAWLPIYGTFKLEELRTLQRYCFDKLIENDMALCSINDIKTNLGDLRDFTLKETTTKEIENISSVQTTYIQNIDNTKEAFQ